MNDEMNQQQQDEQEVEITAEEHKNNIDIGGWLKQSWELFKTDILKYIVSALIVGGISIITCLVLSGPMMVGYYKCVLKKIHGEDFEYGDLFDGVKTQFLPSFILMIAVFIAISFVSFILMIVPVVGQVASYAIQIAASLFLSYMYLQIAEMEETLEVGRLIDLGKLTLNKLKSDYAMFFVWALVISFITFAGLVVCCVGSLVTYPFGVIAIAISYIAIFKNEAVVNVVAEEVISEEQD